MGIEYMKSKCFNFVIIGDGTFCKCSAGGCLIIFVTFTGNREILPLAFGWSPSESKEGVESILELLKSKMPDSSSVTFIVDEGKGLKSAIETIFKELDYEIHNCCWHIIDKFPKNIREILYNMIKSEDILEVANCIKILEVSNPSIHKTIIKKILKFIRFFFKNHSCDSSIESMNASVKRLDENEPFAEFRYLYFL